MSQNFDMIAHGIVVHHSDAPTRPDLGPAIEAALRSAYAAGAAAERERIHDLIMQREDSKRSLGVLLAQIDSGAAAPPATAEPTQPEEDPICRHGAYAGRCILGCQPEPARPLTLEERAASIVDSPFRIPAVAQLCRDFAREALRVQYEALKGEPYGTQWHYEQHVAAEAALAAAEKGEVPR